jgi:hypothetical protein
MLKIDNLSNDIDMTAVRGGLTIQNGQGYFGNVTSGAAGGLVAVDIVNYMPISLNENIDVTSLTENAIALGTGNTVKA